MPLLEWSQNAKNTLKWVGIGALAFGVAYISGKAMKKYLKKKTNKKENREHLRM